MASEVVVALRRRELGTIPPLLQSNEIPPWLNGRRMFKPIGRGPACLR
jgi:hypothetical protein